MQQPSATKTRSSGAVKGITIIIIFSVTVTRETVRV